MPQLQRRTWKYGILAATVLAVFLTRLPTLSFHYYVHPDEHVFYLGANSLLNSILHPGTPFEEFMEYPEGAYLFHLPFQLLGKVVSALTGAQQDLALWGRGSAVCYFTLAVLLGMRLLERYLGKGLMALGIYGLSMTASLFFLEQSRYGTGDMISLMLMMLLLNVTARALEPGAGLGWWSAACFLCGVLGAVKYPQIVFLLIPLTAYLTRPGAKRRAWPLLLAAAVLGFFLFSPKALLDPAYILRAVQREGGVYVAPGMADRLSLTANHLLNAVLYLLLYCELPLLPLAVLAGFGVGLVRRFRNRGQALTGTVRLFQVIVPGVFLFFFTYNLFVQVMYFRVYTTLFGVLALYSAAMAERLLRKGGPVRLGMLALTGCMLLRGLAFVWVLSDERRDMDIMEEKVAKALDENWTQTHILNVLPLGISGTTEPEISTMEHGGLPDLVAYNGGLELQPGQLLITGAYEYYVGSGYLLPVSEETLQEHRLWTAFKEANQDYLVGQQYPDAYYYLFGGWIQGSTLSQYELPCQYVYYRGE